MEIGPWPGNPFLPSPTAGSRHQQTQVPWLVENVFKYDGIYEVMNYQNWFDTSQSDNMT